MKYLYIILLSLCSGFSSCSFLDVIPDNIATVDMAFNNREGALKYLNTCYSFMPKTFDSGYNASLFGADDVATIRDKTTNWDLASAWSFVRSEQSATNTVYNYWNVGLYRGIHECNIFLANVDNVPNLPIDEMNRWVGEVRTLKAYYLYWLFVHYGPIPLLKENVSIDSPIDEMRIYRQKVDDVVAYIVELLDSAIEMNPGLPSRVISSTTELGRITLPAAMAIKAKVLLTAASPLFNGNTDYANFLDPRDNQPFFNQNESIKKWEAAAEASQSAILEAEKTHRLYTFKENVNYPLTDQSKLHMTLRNVVASRSNEEHIFAPGSAGQWVQFYSQPHLTSWHVGRNMQAHSGQHAPTLNVVEEYYSKNGVPMEEDKTISMPTQYELVTTPADNPVDFAPSYRTVRLHLDREPRFYANIGFDGGKWFNEEVSTIEAAYSINSKNKGLAGFGDVITASATGYFDKKLASHKNINSESMGFSVYEFPNLQIRLADLYLMYSEAANEAMGAPNDEVYEYIQRVRHRAGLDVGKTMVDTWKEFSKFPNNPTTKDGMREIIHRERLIELQFEGSRLNDIRRWKKADLYFNKQIRGWNILGETPESFYNQTTVYMRTHSVRDYLWPIDQSHINKNTRLLQNPMWK